MKHKGKIIFLSLTSGIGLGVGSLVDANAGHLVNEQKEIIAEAQEFAMSTDNNYTNLKSRIGESCLSFLDDYALGVGLENTPEDSVVSDLLRDPDFPCTDQPNVVREHVRAFQNTDKANVDAQNALQAAKSQLDIYRDNEEDKNYLHGLFAGFAVGCVLTGIVWVVFESEY